jgi:hypothetical protein
MSLILKQKLQKNTFYDVDDGDDVYLGDLCFDVYLDFRASGATVVMEPVLYLSLFPTGKGSRRTIRNRIRTALKARGLRVTTPRDSLVADLIIFVDQDPWMNVDQIESTVVEAIKLAGFDLTNRITHEGVAIIMSRIEYERFFTRAAHLVMMARSLGGEVEVETVWDAREYDVLHHLITDDIGAGVITDLSDWCRIRPDDCVEVLAGLAKIERVVGSWEVKKP